MFFKKKPGVREVVLIGFLFSVIYFLLEKYLTYITELSFWVFCLLISIYIYTRGFDFYRVMFSFTLTFLTIVSFIYISLVVLIGIPGLPKAIALILLPLVVVSTTGYLHRKLVYKLIHWYVRYKYSKRIVREKLYMYRTKSFLYKIWFKVKSGFFKIDPVMWVFTILGLIILIIFLVIPISLIMYYAFETSPGRPFYQNLYNIFRSHLESPSLRSIYVRLTLLKIERFYYFEEISGERILVIRGVNYGILLNSLINAALVTTVSTALGIIVAFILARYNFPGKNIMRLLAIVPLFVTPFVNAYAIKILFSDTGPISMITNALFGFRIRIDSLAGVALAQIMAFYPIVYLNAYSSFLNVDPSTEEQGENLGAHGLKLFLSITLPLALPGIVAGSIIVFIFSLEDLGAPIVFQEWNLMSSQIYLGFVSETGFVSPERAALGLVLLLLAVSGFIAIRSYVGMRTYAMISRGGRWLPRVHRFGLKGKVIVYLIILPLILFTALPQIFVILLALNILPPRGFALSFNQATLDYFQQLFSNPDIFKYIRNTLLYSTVAVTLATFIAVMVAYSVSRVKIKGLNTLLDTLATIPLAIPGLVIALGYFYFFTDLPEVFRNAPLIGDYIYDFLYPLKPTAGPGAFQAWIVLITAYSIRKLPFIVRSVYAGFQQVHEALEEAALNLGASRSRVIFGVILPFILTYIISGSIIGFIYISTEVSTSITIGGLAPDQAPMTFYMRSIYQGGTVEGVQIAAAMGVLLILIQSISIFLIVVVFKQRYAFIGA